ncbi:hypothetical protein, partial [Yersinia ruckeri]|uniref:hypothetical protein n=1 Tax=Yersinia ruckeri TaxID=29486 RepID=UPI002237759F
MPFRPVTFGNRNNRHADPSGHHQVKGWDFFCPSKTRLDVIDSIFLPPDHGNNFYLAVISGGLCSGQSN